jgi:hypothetical protein
LCQQYWLAEGVLQDQRVLLVHHASHVAMVTLAGKVGDMLATRQNVAYFCPDRPILATEFLCDGTPFCQHFST